MAKQQISLCERLKHLGYAQNNRMRLYGEDFELLSDPIVVADHLVFVGASEQRSGHLRRVCIALSNINMVRRDPPATGKGTI